MLLVNRKRLLIINIVMYADRANGAVFLYYIKKIQISIMVEMWNEDCIKIQDNLG